MSSLTDFLSNISNITILVMLWLSAYFLVTLWITIYKYIGLNSIESEEKNNLNEMLTDNSNIPRNAVLEVILANREVLTPEILHIWKLHASQQYSKGLVFVSIISSTAPFIGLFGTVVEILSAFGELGGGVSFDVIAPIISKALIATACGILVAIPAYSSFLFLRRKVQNIMSLIQIQINLILSNNK